MVEFQNCATSAKQKSYFSQNVFMIILILVFLMIKARRKMRLKYL